MRTLRWTDSASAGGVPDVTGSISYPLGRVAATYVSVGRSLTSLDEGGTTFSVAGGVSFRFSAATP